MIKVEDIREGVRLVGNVDGVKITVIGIERNRLGTASGNICVMSATVRLMNEKTGCVFTYGLDALTHCDISVATD